LEFGMWFYHTTPNITMSIIQTNPYKLRMVLGIKTLILHEIVQRANKRDWKHLSILLHEIIPAEPSLGTVWFYH
jgi:hypothetical protein